ncbi:MAG: arginine--tRNA ligase [Candidatus Staskawiczbacteria bacterium]|nr:arginine--tRNA ligase [Candidatus Staskawiczbacteria bacterium]
MKEEIKKIIEKAVKDFGEVPEGFSVDIPDDKMHGDYSTNVALVLSKKLGKESLPAGRQAREVADSIKQKIGENKLFSKIEIAGPGFINFFISDKVFVDNLKNIDKSYGKGGELKNKKVIIDYTDPNPFKDFHIGHLMSNAIGESLSRIFEVQGAKVKRVCYQGDVGMHVAKAIWGKINGAKNLGWGAAYAYGAQMFEDDENVKKEIMDLNKKIYARNDKDINKLYDQGKKESLKYFDRIYKQLGTKFDELIFESQTGPIGKKIVEKGLEDGIFEKGDNDAVIFKGEKYARLPDGQGLHTRVFINSEGLPTYEAKDLGLAEVKYNKYKYDQSVVITGNEVNDYFKVMLCAMGQVAPKLAEKTKHIGHGMLRLPEGKMSSRTGKVITGESLIRKVEELVKEKIKDRELSETEKKEIIENVAIGAIKYSILKQSIGHDIIFDFDRSISFEGDSGPYLQYAYTRAQSVLRKAKAEKIKPSFKNIPNEITELEKIICRFQEIVLKAGQAYEPHFISLYLTELAAIFNTYYAENKIVDKTDKYSPYKLALTKAFTIVMKNGMWLLGIKTLEKM